MDAGECGRTRGTCFIVRRLEVVAVAEAAVNVVVCFGWGDFFVFFFSLNAHGLLQVQV